MVMTHVKSVAVDEVDILFSAPICNPVPIVHTFNTDDDLADIGFYEFKEGSGFGIDFLVNFFSP